MKERRNQEHLEKNIEKSDRIGRKTVGGAT